jgi:hypothetical protein
MCDTDEPSPRDLYSLLPFDKVLLAECIKICLVEGTDFCFFSEYFHIKTKRTFRLSVSEP